MNITQFSIEEVRCFAERQNFEIRPLTFLVGENSTGKTTALACFHVLADFFTHSWVDFNRMPYKMGIFRDIVRNSRKLEKTFKLGFNLRHDNVSENEEFECVVEFVQKKEGFEPAIKSVTMKFTDGKIVFNAEDGAEKGIRLTHVDKEKNHFHLACGTDFKNDFWPFYVLHLRSEGKEYEGEESLQQYLRKKPLVKWWPVPVSAFSIAPVRSRPERTYDPKRIFDDPEGSDIPMQLMQIKEFDNERWNDVKEGLVKFGRRSGLFQDIEVKNLGAPGGPFQLRVKVRGPSSSIIDVGYGVSQILPILVHILDPPTSRWGAQAEIHILFSLLQEPEVHLHPKAQAELSSLLATLAGQSKRSFLVETHSDYMIDRARIEIRKGTIRPEDVSLIYLEPKGRTVKVHNISFDEMANMIGVPKHYGEYFLKETNRLMGFED